MPSHDRYAIEHPNPLEANPDRVHNWLVIERYVGAELPHIVDWWRVTEMVKTLHHEPNVLLRHDPMGTDALLVLIRQSTAAVLVLGEEVYDELREKFAKPIVPIKTVLSARHRPSKSTMC